ncbi:response regulator [Pedobacter aquatilis]|uniref:response regulator n=1 Tax=Pedobacter aquatilis TaxID=351343 RepID=UPI00292E06F0|nr:response regulator [Pedobacter aquatilis]
MELKGKKILVVDDDRLFLSQMEHQLTEEKFHVKCIEKLGDIDTSIESFRPDLIILDILLDDGDGRLVCNDLKNHSATSHIPIVVITGLSFEKISEIECEADATLGKPFSMDNLLINITQLLR